MQAGGRRFNPDQLHQKREARERRLIEKLKREEEGSSIENKLTRASGGCLGVGRRGKTWQAAISHGEELNILGSVDF